MFLSEKAKTAKDILNTKFLVLAHLLLAYVLMATTPALRSTMYNCPYITIMIIGKAKTSMGNGPDKLLV